MQTYISEAILESGLSIEREAATPARKNLFEVDPTSNPLDQKRSESFHSVVAKLLYVVTRARIDILLVVGFLCSRVSKNTVEDKGKL
jgi:hypothetical protein